MKKEEKIGLSEAIKRHYRTEPLKIQLPMVVADRVFGKKTSPTSEALLYMLAGVCGLAILTLCFLALPQWGFSPLLTGFLVMVAAIAWLSYKEIAVWSARAEQFYSSKIN